MTVEKILITVKTYPSLSKKYGELVCTAGIKENGEWIRIYPIPYRKLYVNNSQYEKYRWVECEVSRNYADPRKESHKVNYKEIKLLDFIDTKPNWNKRRNIVLKNGYCTNLRKLVESYKEEDISLVTYKPTIIDDFIWKEVEREYKKDVLDKLEADKMQLKLFSDPIDDVPNFKEIPKLPYEFSYVFKDDDGTSHTIDTLQRVRGNNKNQNAYSKDYYDLGILKSFADKYNLCLAVIHHLRKPNKKDDYVFDQISGTNGIMGAADTALVLKDYDKNLNEATLYITGRDVESEELILQFNNDNCRWSCLGNAEIQFAKQKQKDYEDNPIVIAIKRFLKEKEEWSGTATNLKQNLIKYGLDDNYHTATLAKKLKSLTDDFKKYSDIIYTAPPKNGSNGYRIHKFKLCRTLADEFNVDELFADISDISDTTDSN